MILLLEETERDHIPVEWPNISILEISIILHSVAVLSRLSLAVDLTMWTECVLRTLVDSAVMILMALDLVPRSGEKEKVFILCEHRMVARYWILSVCLILFGSQDSCYCCCSAVT